MYIGSETVGKERRKEEFPFPEENEKRPGRKPKTEKKTTQLFEAIGKQKRSEKRSDCCAAAEEGRSDELQGSICVYSAASIPC